MEVGPMFTEPEVVRVLKAINYYAVKAAHEQGAKSSTNNKLRKNFAIAYEMATGKKPTKERLDEIDG